MGFVVNDVIEALKKDYPLMKIFPNLEAEIYIYLASSTETETIKKQRLELYLSDLEEWFMEHAYLKAEMHVNNKNNAWVENLFSGIRLFDYSLAEQWLAVSKDFDEINRGTEDLNKRVSEALALAETKMAAEKKKGFFSRFFG
jgi:hypothetical protein